MSRQNYMKVSFDARSENESFARMAAAGFAMQLNPTVEELEDIRTAVSEAVTNAIIHGYEDETKQVVMECVIDGDCLTLRVRDQGVGIENVEQAMQPFYTTKPEQERSGMGFAFMEAFMDEIRVTSEPGKGTQVTMIKQVEGGE